MSEEPKLNKHKQRSRDALAEEILRNTYHVTIVTADSLLDIAKRLEGYKFTITQDNWEGLD